MSTVTVGVRTPRGLVRVTLPKDAPVTVSTLLERIGDAGDACLYRDRKPSEPLVPSQILADLRHGDLFYLSPRPTVAMDVSSPPPSSSLSSSSAPATESGAQRLVDSRTAVDEMLESLDGRVYLSAEHEARHKTALRTPGRMVRLEDLPVDPWDARVLQVRDLKHMSFHAMLRQHRASRASGKGSGAVPTLIPQISCRPEHGRAYARTVTLQSQPWRNVDSVMFESPEMVDSFLAGWRESGLQRMGILYGHYTRDEVCVCFCVMVCVFVQIVMNMS